MKRSGSKKNKRRQDVVGASPDVTEPVTEPGPPGAVAAAHDEPAAAAAKTTPSVEEATADIWRPALVETSDAAPGPDSSSGADAAAMAFVEGSAVAAASLSRSAPAVVPIEAMPSIRTSVTDSMITEVRGRDELSLPRGAATASPLRTTRERPVASPAVPREGQRSSPMTATDHAGRPIDSWSNVGGKWPSSIPHVPLAGDQLAPAEAAPDWGLRLGVIALLGVLLLGVGTWINRFEVDSLRQEIARQTEVLTKLSEARTTVANAPAAPTTGADSPSIAAAPAPLIAVPAERPAAPAEAAPAEAPAQNKVASAASPTDEASPEELAATRSLLGGWTLTEWRKRHFSLAGRRSVKVGKLDAARMDALAARLEARPLPPVVKVELDDLRRIHRAQSVLVGCKLMDASERDLQLGGGTRAKLAEVASGALSCDAGDAGAQESFEALRTDLGNADWEAYLSDARTLSIATMLLQ